LTQKAQKKRLGEKKMPLLRALPEPATFFEKKVDQKTKLGAARRGFPAAVAVTATAKRT
jgi:hypothetical protein